MKLFVKAKPGAYEERVLQIDLTHFEVSVREPPEHGLANRAIVRALAEHLDVSPSRLSLARGFSSRNKVIELL